MRRAESGARSLSAPPTAAGSWRIPMIDVVFILIVVLVLSVRFGSADSAAEIQIEANTVEQSVSENSRMVTLLKDGSLELDGEPVESDEALLRRLDVNGHRPDVIVDADGTTEIAAVVRLMMVLKEGGHEVRLAVRSLN